MKFVLLFMLLTAPLFARDPLQEIKTQGPKAAAIIKQWQNGAPLEDKRKLHIVYWTPSDREPAPQYRERLTRVLTHIQAYYAKEMKRLGFGPQTINLDMTKDKLLNIHVVKAPMPYSSYKPSDGNKIRKECLPTLVKAGIDASKETIVIFCNMSNWDAEKNRMTQNSPYYAGGNHFRGTAWQVDSPLLDPVYLDKKQPMLHDGQYGHISIGRYNSIFVGGVAHELGHALGLPHNCQRHDEHKALGTALMGGGNRTYGNELRGEGRGSFLTLTHGLRLASHPMFSGCTKDMTKRGRSRLTDIKVTPGEKSLAVTAKLETHPQSPAVHAVVAYCDPEGGSNYDAVTATCIPDKDGNITLNCTSLQPNKKAVLQLYILYANGDATSHVSPRTPYKFDYTVDKNGKPSLMPKK